MAVVIEQSAELPAPPDEVYPWLVEDEKLRRWMKNHRELHGVPGPGATYVQVTETAGDIEERTWTVTAWEPPGHFAARVESKSYDANQDYRLEPADSGTRLTARIEISGGGVIVRVVGGMLRKRAEAELAEDLERLREGLAE